MEVGSGFPSQYIGHDNLQIRGWFDSTINECLPYFDLVQPSTLTPLIAPTHYYDKMRAQRIEQSLAFNEHQSAILKQAAINMIDTGKSHHKLMDRVLDIDLDFGLLKQKELELRINVEINTRVPAAKESSFDKNLGDILIPVLSVQVQMDEFEPQLWQLEPYFFHPSYRQARELLTHKFLDAIYNKRPDFLIGCEHYAAQRHFNFCENGWDSVD